MRHREVLTIDRQRIGRIVGEVEDYFIVECGALRKSRHALPKHLAHDGGRAVVVAMGRQILIRSPRFDGGDLSEAAAYWNPA